MDGRSPAESLARRLEFDLRQSTACAVGRKSAGFAAAQEKKQASTVALDWKEVYYTNCPLVRFARIRREQAVDTRRSGSFVALIITPAIARRAHLRVRNRRWRLMTASVPPSLVVRGSPTSHDV